MDDAVIGIASTVAVLVVLVPLLLTHAKHKTRQIEDAWRLLAERHRLRFQPGRALQVSGSVGGHPFVLKNAGSGNHTSFAMEVELSGELPSGLRMKPIGRRTRHGETVGVPGIRVHERTGRVDIDEHVRVRADHPDELPAYLTAERQRAALRLADIGGELDGRKLSVGVTREADDLEHLDEALRVLESVAPVLDAA